MVITLGFLPEPLALITDNHILRPATLAAGLSVALLASAAHEQPDTLLLESVEVVATGPIAPITRRDGSILFTDKALDHTVRTMGEADMLRLVSLAAGASSASDYTSGPTFDGSSWGNNTIIAGGMPVIFPYHFGGIYSALNSAIYPRAELFKSIHPADHPDVLGAVTSLSTPAVTDAAKAEINVGMTASSAAIQMPVSPRLTIGAAVRASYISLLYGGMLGGKSTDVDYNFEDVDVVARWTPDAANTISATLHYNGDRLDYNDKNYGMTTRLHWRNAGGAVTWDHRSSIISHTHTAFVTSLDNRLSLDITDVSVGVPASTLSAGINGQFNHNNADCLTSPLQWKVGYSVEYNSFMPQSASVEGLGEETKATPRRNSSASGRTWGTLRWLISDAISTDLGLALTAYGAQGGYFTFLPSPRLTFNFTVPWGTTATIHAGRYVQCIHFLGMSEIGLASNFRMGASAAVPPQSAWNFATTLSHTLRGTGLSIAADIYYKIIDRDAEYNGAVLDLLDNTYRDIDHVAVTHGYNTGASLTLRGFRGPVAWWIAYGFGTARRRYPATKEWINASSDMGHSLTACASWPINSHWTVNGQFSLASGRVYTPVECIYIVGERIVTQYGRRNSARFPLYHRLDMGVSYTFRTGGHRLPLEHSVNLSVLNIYAHSNVELQSWNVNMVTGRYYLRQVSSLYRAMPSLSYTIKFSLSECSF